MLKIAVVSVTSLGFAEYYAHYHMKPYINNSYHVTIGESPFGLYILIVQVTTKPAISSTNV